MSDDNFDIDVRVQIPRSHYKTLRAAATEQKTTVAALIRAMVIRAVPEAAIPRPASSMTRAERDEYIMHRNGEGATDGLIARELGQTHSTISSRRARLGLAAVQPSGRPKQVTS